MSIMETWRRFACKGYPRQTPFRLPYGDHKGPPSHSLPHLPLLYYATASTTLATFQALSRDLTGILYLHCYTAII